MMLWTPVLDREKFGVVICNFQKNANSTPEIGKNVISISEDGKIISKPGGSFTDEQSSITLPVSVSSMISMSEPCSTDVVSLLENNDKGCLADATNSQSLAVNANNTISIPEVMSPNGTNLSFSSDLIPFSPTFASLFSPKIEKNSSGKECMNLSDIKNNSTLSCSPILDLDFIDSHLKKEFDQTERNNASGKLRSTHRDPILSSKPESFELKQNNLQLQAVSDLLSSASDNAITKNALSNHVLSVDEQLESLQNQLGLGDFDSTMLLGLFSADDVANNAALASHFASDNGVLRDANVNIIGNEVVQLSPSEFEIFDDTGFLDYFEPEDHSPSNSQENEKQSATNLSYEKILQNIKKERTDSPCPLSRNNTTNVGVSPPKKAKVIRNRSRRRK